MILLGIERASVAENATLVDTALGHDHQEAPMGIPWSGGHQSGLGGARANVQGLGSTLPERPGVGGPCLAPVWQEA